jgi:hypothetical protein
MGKTALAVMSMEHDAWAPVGFFIRNIHHQHYGISKNSPYRCVVSQCRSFLDPCGLSIAGSAVCDGRLMLGRLQDLQETATKNHEH